MLLAMGDVCFAIFRHYTLSFSDRSFTALRSLRRRSLFPQPRYPTVGNNAMTSRKNGRKPFTFLLILRTPSLAQTFLSLSVLRPRSSQTDNYNENFYVSGPAKLVNPRNQQEDLSNQQTWFGQAWWQRTCPAVTSDCNTACSLLQFSPSNFPF